ncbi:MAG: pyridoxamine 5'-phosphate oxidase family protein [Synergistaceae bacterium]|jgi:general stress protein 26|nr:pyridoxamine 5'-phosphate oxidase family protein [Synergistaceae bacterium]
MKTSELGAKEARAKTERVLAGAKVVYMATNGSHGHPNVRAMSPAKTDGAKALWFVTDVGSSKIAELVNDGKSVIYAMAPRAAGECRVWGSVDILDDEKSRKIAWRDEFAEHFPGGKDSPELRVLRFNVSNGVYCGKTGKKGEFKN